MTDYWKTCIEEAVSELGITVTDEQLKDLSEWVEGAHDNYGMAHGHDCIPNPLASENRRLAKALEIEREKIHCEGCNGTGRIYSQGPHHGSDTQCWKCHGEGRHSR